MTLEEKARWLVSLVQGTMALEGQALSQESLDRLIQHAIELLKADEQVP
jgi:1,2-phenylacetyl-CoA epoxidase catalytic subunit